MQGVCKAFKNPMNTVILNREAKLPTDGWHQIEVPGEHVNHLAKVVQVIDAKAVESILNRFKADATKPNFAGLLVDRDHFSLDPKEPSEAMGWALELRNREGIPEARIDWTAAGRPRVEGKDYKFFSTVYDPEECEQLGTRIVNGKPYRMVRPLHLERLALTNDPNNKGGKPISNREANSGAAAETKTNMKSVLKLLGLADDASEESAVAVVQKIQNRATTAEGQVTTLTSERDTLLNTQVESDLEKYKNRFKATERAKWQKQLIANRAGTIELLESIEVAATTGETDPKKITNRQTAKTPEEIAAEKNAGNEKARGAKIANRASELRRNNPHLTRSAAFKQAEAEIAQ